MRQLLAFSMLTAMISNVALLGWLLAGLPGRWALETWLIHAAVVLATEGGAHLILTGRGLDRPELDGARVEVHVDHEPVGTIELLADRPIEFTAPVPAAARARRYVGVQLLADDFAYVGDDLRRCVSFRLTRIAIEP